MPAGLRGAAALHGSSCCHQASSPGEQALADKVLAAIPGADVVVEDVSGMLSPRPKDALACLGLIGK